MESCINFGCVVYCSISTETGKDCKKGFGTGTVAKYEDHHFVITNQHVLNAADDAKSFTFAFFNDDPEGRGTIMKVGMISHMKSIKSKGSM